MFIEEEQRPVEKTPTLSETPAICVLYVEKDPMDAVMVRKELGEERNQYRVISVRDGVDALDYLRNKNIEQPRQKPDLILLAEDVPAIDSTQLVAIVNADENLRNIPLIYIQRSRDASNPKKFSLLAKKSFSEMPLSKRLYPFLHALNKLINNKR